MYDLKGVKRQQTEVEMDWTRYQYGEEQMG